MTKKPLVYMVVLNWNGLEHLKYCLPSLSKTKYSNYHILLVDNASEDGSVEYAKKNFPDIEIVVNEDNLGWSGGNNVGIRKALETDADYIILLNNDIRVHPPWIEYAVEVCEKDPSIGLLGFNVFGATRKVPIKVFREAVKRFKKLKLRPSEKIAGLAFFVRREAFENLGLIDEGYFAYGEENDFEERVKEAGYSIVQINVPLWHYSEGAWGKRPWKAAYFAIRNTVRFGIKNYPFWKVMKIIAFVTYMSSMPFKRIDREDPTQRRLRPGISPVNFGLLVYCLFWNIFNLPATLKERRKHKMKILKAQKALKKRLNRNKKIRQKTKKGVRK